MPPQERIIFADDFESGDFAMWDSESNFDDPRRIRLTTDPVHVYRGHYAVEVTARIGSGSGGQLNTWFMPGYDRVYARWYCKFAADFDQGNFMHLNTLLANRRDNKWSAYGKAGIRPSGDDFFISELVPWRDWGRHPPPGEMMMYTYHMDMPADPNSGMYWGENKKTEEKVVLERDRWYCMEMMVEANTPGEADGEQAFWIDGQLAGRFTGIRWRSTADLKINNFWAMLYVHESAQINRVWFDEIVVAQDYIGPLERDTAAEDSTWGAVKVEMEEP